MDIGTIAGMGLGVICIVVSILLSGNLGVYFNIPSIFVVVGGVVASTLVAYPLNVLKGLVKATANAFQSKQSDLSSDVDMIIEIANVARREGILALEESIEENEDEFLKKGIMLIIDGSDAELVRSIMETELAFIQERHSSWQGILLTMSSLSPAYGMIGTLIGLINMLQSLSDVDSLGPNMGVALITTFYGCVLANLIFTPLAKKLKVMSDDEYLRKELILEGILSIQDGENPRIIREKLNAFLSRSDVLAAEESKAVPQSGDDE